MLCNLFSQVRISSCFAFHPLSHNRLTLNLNTQATWMQPKISGRATSHLWWTDPLIGKHLWLCRPVILKPNVRKHIQQARDDLLFNVLLWDQVCHLLLMPCNWSSSNLGRCGIWKIGEASVNRSHKHLGGGGLSSTLIVYKNKKVPAYTQDTHQ